MQTVVEKFKLSDWLGEEKARTMLVQAGYRGQGPYVVFLFFRMVAPLAMLLGSAFYVFILLQLDYPWTVKVGICLARDLSWHLPAEPVREEQDHAPAGLDQPGVSRTRST